MDETLAAAIREEYPPDIAESLIQELQAVKVDKRKVSQTTGRDSKNPLDSQGFAWNVLERGNKTETLRTRDKTDVHTLAAATRNVETPIANVNDKEWPELPAKPNLSFATAESVEFLQSCLPELDRDSILQALEANGNDVEQALNALLISQDPEDELTTAWSADSPSRDTPQDPLATLCLLFPDLPVDRLERELNQQPANGTLDLDAIIEKLMAASAANGASTSTSRKSQQRSSGKQHISVPIRMNAPLPDQRALLLDGDNLLQNAETGASRYAIPSSDGRGSEFYHQKVASFAVERNDNFRKAAQAFKKGGQYFGQVALYYSQEGHQWNRKLHDANLHAAVETVVENRVQQQVQDPYTLDLHYTHVKEGLILLREELRQWYSRESNAGQRPRRKFTVITGQGNRSERGGRLGPAVERMLLREGWIFDRGEGHFIVKNRM